MIHDVSQLDSQLHIGPQTGGIGARRVALLEAIETTGSITAGARAVGLSYKGAWDAVNAINNLAETPLVQRNTGGSGGGGTYLTERGHRLVRTYRAAEEEQARFLEQLNRRLSHLADDFNLMERLAMQTSARNQLLGTVTEVTRGAVNAEVAIELAGGDSLTAVITVASADNLGLETGLSVTALIKASWMIIAAGDMADAGLSTRNRLVGTVEAITLDDVASEVTVKLPGGATLAAVITRESADSLDLSVGNTATVLFKASSVILGQAN